MATRREQIFAAGKAAAASKTVIPATVKFRHDKKKGALAPLQPHEKMLCALRKALATFSDRSGGKRYYIAGNKVQLLRAPQSTVGKSGEAQTFTAQGRCRLGVAHAGDHITSIVVQFSITFRDTKDSRGLPDVEFIEPTTIDELPKNTPIDVDALA